MVDQLPLVSFLVRGSETQPTTKGLHIISLKQGFLIKDEMPICAFSDVQNLDTDKSCQLVQEIVGLFSGLL